MVATLLSEVGLQVSSYSNRPVGGVSCFIVARSSIVGRVRHTAKGPYGLPLAPAWVVNRPHPTALFLILSRFSAMSIELAGSNDSKALLCGL